MDCSSPGSFVHEIFQARILEQVAISYCRGSSRPRDWTCVSCISCIGRWILLLEPPEKPITKTTDHNYFGYCSSDSVSSLYLAPVLCHWCFLKSGSFHCGFILLLLLGKIENGRYSKSPTYEPTSFKLSNMWTCIPVSSHIRLVHVSGVHCHMPASSTNGCALCTLLYNTI